MAMPPIVPMPPGVRIFNGTNQPCDALVGPCSCQAWHDLNGTIESCKQKGIYTKFLEDAFKLAILESHARFVADQKRRASAKKRRRLQRIEGGGKRR